MELWVNKSAPMLGAPKKDRREAVLSLLNSTELQAIRNVGLEVPEDFR